VGKSRSTITNLLRLMNLTDEVKKMLEYGDIEMGHARALLALEGLVQIRAADEVVAKSLSVRETELLVKRFQQPADSEEKSPRQPDEQLQQLAGELSQRFSVPVKISSSANGKGKILINFNSREELESVLQQLR
jgi:ParB family chromosome partitioning protein